MAQQQHNLQCHAATCRLALHGNGLLGMETLHTMGQAVTMVCRLVSFII
jgi:hypothetical protein